MRELLLAIPLIILIYTCGRYEGSDCYVYGKSCENWKHEATPGPKGDPGVPGPAGPRGSPGTNGRDGATGEPGVQGPGGQPGLPGPSGSPGSPGPMGPAGDPGHDGSDGSPGAEGPQGPAGPIGPTGSPGLQGPAGADGSSCSVQQLSNGARISCTDGTEVVILNGEVGATGPQGPAGVPGTPGSSAPPTAYSVVSVIDPCGKQATFDEVLLKLYNGQILAHYASGSNQFLTFITPGNYVTTDGTHCYFTLNSNGAISGEHN